MSTLRRWELEPASPYALHLAADARLSATDYHDDQSWDVEIGRGDEPAFALHTKYGGRVGLASLVPLWTHEQHIIYQAQTYHKAPLITAFAPSYLQTEGWILPGLELRAEHFALDSHSIAGLYTLHNRGQRDLRVRFELFGHVGSHGKEQKLAIISMADGGHALSMGALPRLSAVVLIENGHIVAQGGSASPKIGVTVTIPAEGAQTIRWVHVGLPNIQDALSQAKRWFSTNWANYRSAVEQAAQAVPQIRTGNLDWDAVLASSYNRLVQAVFRPTGIFPRETFVAGRIPAYGYSRSGDGTDHPRMWEGQDAILSYLLAPALASIDPQAAEGIVRNMIAVQREDGFIDLKPGSAGQKQHLLATPLLAQTTWNVYQQTLNQSFLADVFSGLRRFFYYWLQQDEDDDGVPEWRADRQTGYLAFPTFAPERAWAQGAAIATVESPDLLGYLIAEANALQQMAEVLNDASAAKDLAQQRQTLANALQEFWAGEAFAYRDRDTHITTTGMDILRDGAGDAEHTLNQGLTVPNRLIVQVIGGVRHVPNITLHVEGVNQQGDTVTETLNAERFLWQNRQGVATTETVFTQVMRIWCDGLSRVYRIQARTMDTSALDINALLPLVAGDLSPEQAAKIAKLAFSKQHFQRHNGLTMSSANDPNFDPSNAEGAGGLWLYWQTRLGEALLEAGYGEQVSAMLKNTLKLLQSVLAETHTFGQFYHSDEAQALGEKGHIAGIAPLWLLQRLIGVNIVSAQRVWLSASFGWGRGITVRQHGVYVRRTPKRVKVEFPSGHIVELDTPLQQDQWVDDPQAAPTARLPQIEQPGEALPPSAPSPVSGSTTTPTRVIIQVEHDD